MAWYFFKLGRFAVARKRLGLRVLEGNNEWKQIFWRLYYRYDATGPGTKD